MADIHETQISEYVVNKIDEAIRQEWIKVYYQPVVRAITGKLCGMESLARWVDPEIGFLSPDKFIGVLEEHKLIHKLDCYIIERACKDLGEMMEQGRPIVPASVNLSRLDFEMLDMVEFVEQAVKKNNIPRDMIHVEVTESMIAAREEMMGDVIRRFREAGYEIWMDDFGSGYSSLNLLKDYDFDLLKMDMTFLSSFTEKSKSIMTYTVSMSKDIGIKTLAEGVETKEHFEFLRSIGCGKVQGYYFGKPEPLEFMIRQIEEKGIPFEERQWRRFYDTVSFEVRDTAAPMVLVLDEDKELKTLYISKGYRSQVLQDANIDNAELDRRIFHRGSPLLKKFREMADILEESGNTETFYYSDNGKYLKMVGRCAAKHNNSYLIYAEVYNITQDEDNSEASRLDAKLRDLHHLYEFVDIVNLKHKDISPVLGRFKYIDTEDYIYDDFKGTVQYFAENFVFPAHRDTFKAFLDLDTIKERVEKSNNSFISVAFKVKQKNGAYEWREAVLMMLPGTSETEYLLGLKPLPMGLSLDGANLEDPINSDVNKYYKSIWENVIWNSGFKFFWKDKNRRFLGVSNAFLDFYGIKSREDIIGKTDEDMHWHVDDVYMNSELDIIRKGNKIKDAPGQCIVHGVLHNIMCSKMPVYIDGEIVGLAGYFIDCEEELAKMNQADGGPSRVDPITKLMNARSFLDVMISYAVQYADTGRNYGLIMLENKTQDRIVNTYGKEVGEELLCKMGSKIVDVTEQSATVARTKNSMFAIMTNVETKEELEKLTIDVVNSIESIREIDDNSVTLRIKAVNRLRTEPDTTDENIYQKVIDSLALD